jgi:hypothetical protein
MASSEGAVAATGEDVGSSQQLGTIGTGTRSTAEAQREGIPPFLPSINVRCVTVFNSNFTFYQHITIKNPMCVDFRVFV